MFGAVIFDWDATLADTQRVIVFSFQQVLREMGVSIPNVGIERRIGMGTAETFREILRETGLVFDEGLIRQLVDKKSQNQISLRSQVQLFSGAIDLLEALQGRVKMGLASMNTKSVIEALLGEKDLGKYFEVVVTADDVLHSKPDPEIFLKCACELGVLPLECVVIEDSLFGVRAAKLAGMCCIGVTTGVYDREELMQEEPDLVVSGLGQTDVLRFIFGS